jgi:hypothetical protein
MHILGLLLIWILGFIFTTLVIISYSELPEITYMNLFTIATTMTYPRVPVVENTAVVDALCTSFNLILWPVILAGIILITLTSKTYSYVLSTKSAHFLYDKTTLFLNQILRFIRRIN